jgi:hypothetical protein
MSTIPWLELTPGSDHICCGIFVVNEFFISLSSPILVKAGLMLMRVKQWLIVDKFS